MEDILAYTVIDESTCFTLSEACRLCRVDDQFVRDMVQEGLITPAGSSARDWNFAARELRRIQVTVRLQRDLGVNLPGAALALDLLDELNRLRASSR